MYIGSSIRNLQEQLQEHLTTKSSPVFKYKDDNPTIHLITLAPCKDRQELNKVEIEYIRHYSEKYGDHLLNEQSVPKQTKLNTNIKRKLRQKIKCVNACARNLVIKSRSKMIQ